MQTETVYRCRRCHKILFHILSDGTLEVRKGKQRIAASYPQRAEVTCDRCGKKDAFSLRGGEADA